MRPRALPLLAIGLLVLLNAWLYRELFYTEFFDNFQSNESMMAVIGAFLRDHPGARWFPLWNAGLPIEHTYALAVPAATAVLSALSGVSTELALHIVAGFVLAAFPAAWYWLSRRLGAGFGQAFTAAAVFSVATLSSVLVPQVATDLGDRTESRLIRDVVEYGDIAHPAALLMAGAAIGCVLACVRKRSYGWFCGAVFLGSGAMLANGFGSTALGLFGLCAVVAADAQSARRTAFATAGMGALGYLCACWLYTPSLALTIAKNSQTVDGDYRFRPATALVWLTLLGGMAALRWALRRFSYFERFAAIASWLFTGMMAIWFSTAVSALPQPSRYHMEANVALALLAAAVVWRVPAKALAAALAALAAIGIAQTVRIRHTAAGLLKPVEIRSTHEYDDAKWIGEHIGSRRVFAGGDLVFWMNLFNSTPQLSGGHDPYAPNFVQRVAVFTIYSGLNAGARDGEISTMWLKAFGTRAIAVPRSGSEDRYHPFGNPDKFEGLLPKVREVNGHAIYCVPARSDSLAGIVPAAAIVRHAPTSGLDTGELSAYVRALDDPALPLAQANWIGTDRARINATVTRDQVVSVQTTYDPGWTARVDGTEVPVRSDGLGLMVIDPACEGPCDIDVEFTGGPERAACRVVSLCTIAGLFLWPAIRRVRATIQT